ncbi:hypothetical protein KP509_03G057200 [Ceratopteris richardii]|uniref:Uncharacterized protein n=1 Tax=Ceratopteris richardii TaxID=49495 RepID=A0A8T2V095_CERRI|nr:hypothetical protein KP509_03G057200 [Ceratopteris richardii]
MHAWSAMNLDADMAEHALVSDYELCSFTAFIRLNQRASDKHILTVLLNFCLVQGVLALTAARSRREKFQPAK